MELVETAVFTKRISAMLRDDEYAEFQRMLAAHPEAGARIKGGAGLRKVRIGVRTHGKRGGGRVIYYWIVDRHTILLLYAYAKNEAADLTPQQVSRLAAVVAEELKAR